MRMNNDTRWSMRNNAVFIKYNKRAKKFLKREKALAYEIYQSIYTKDIQLLMLRLPAKAFHYENSIRVIAATSAKALGPNIGYSQYQRNLKLRWLLPMFATSRVNIWELPTNLRRKVKRYFLQLAAFENEKEDYTNNVKNFLTSCKSCKQMLELLPESYAWLPDVEGCSDVNIADLASKVTKL